MNVAPWNGMYTGLRWYWMVLNGIEWYWTVLNSIWLYCMVWSQISKEILCMKFKFWGWMQQLTNNITLDAVFQRLGNHAHILHLKLGGWLDQKKSTIVLEVLSQELSNNDNIYSCSRSIKKFSHFQKFRYYTPNDVTAGWTTSNSTRPPLLKKG